MTIVEKFFCDIKTEGSDLGSSDGKVSFYFIKQNMYLEIPKFYPSEASTFLLF